MWCIGVGILILQENYNINVFFFFISLLIVILRTKHLTTAEAGFDSPWFYTQTAEEVILYVFFIKK